jgi:hypothetical protein
MSRRFGKAEAYRISLVKVADKSSLGVMYSLTRVGIPEKALRTKLRCLAYMFVRWTSTAGYHIFNIPAEIIAPHFVSSNAWWNEMKIEICWCHESRFTRRDEALQHGKSRFHDFLEDPDSKANLIIARYMPWYLLIVV